MAWISGLKDEDGAVADDGASRSKTREGSVAKMVYLL